MYMESKKEIEIIKAATELCILLNNFNILDDTIEKNYPTIKKISRF